MCAKDKSKGYGDDMAVRIKFAVFVMTLISDEHDVKDDS